MPSGAKRPVTLDITVDLEGRATIEIPHDRNQARNAQAAERFTDQLSKALGEVEERHIGDHHHHTHEHGHEHGHLHQ